MARFVAELVDEHMICFGAAHSGASPHHLWLIELLTLRLGGALRPMRSSNPTAENSRGWGSDKIRLASTSGETLVTNRLE